MGEGGFGARKCRPYLYLSKREVNRGVPSLPLSNWIQIGKRNHARKNSVDFYSVIRVVQWSSQIWKSSTYGRKGVYQIRVFSTRFSSQSIGVSLHRSLELMPIYCLDFWFTRDSDIRKHNPVQFETIQQNSPIYNSSIQLNL